MALSDGSVNWDARQASIRAALLNLMLNAIQAMPDGGSVAITTGCDLNTLWLVITDDGPGSHLTGQNICEPFNRPRAVGWVWGCPTRKR